MDIGAILITLAVLVLITMFIFTPIMKRKPKHLQEEHGISSLLAENERILDALQELDFDNKLGKIPSEDYPTMRKALMQTGVSILHRLEEYQQTSTPHDAEKFIEAAIAIRRADASMVDGFDEDEELESLIAKRKNSQNAKSAGFCPKCGNPILVSDTFCPKCGNTLK